MHRAGPIISDWSVCNCLLAVGPWLHLWDRLRLWWSSRDAFSTGTCSACLASLGLKAGRTRLRGAQGGLQSHCIPKVEPCTGHRCHNPSHLLGSCSVATHPLLFSRITSEPASPAGQEFSNRTGFCSEKNAALAGTRRSGETQHI